MDFPLCKDQSHLKAGRHERYMMSQTILASMEKDRRTKLGKYFPQHYEPCGADYATEYLNDMDVRTAIHVDEDKLKNTPTWTECDGSVNSNWNQTDLNAPMMPVYKWLINNADIDIVIYSGDDDSVCATLGTQQFIWEIAPLESNWKAWTFGDTEQLGGYITRFTGITFLTVHGAGHMVPSTRPEQALKVFTDYLDGRLTSKKHLR